MKSNDNPTASIGVRLLRKTARLPERATPGSTGFDLRACFEDAAAAVTIGPDPTLVPTGIALELADDFDAQIRPRSGLTKRGIMVPLGTIDADYRGEVFVTMYIIGTRIPHVVRHGDRIAQLIIARFVPAVFVVRDELSSTERGSGGHGSTGK